MNREDIVRMAREAGMQLAWIATVPDTNKMKVLCDFDQVQRFAALVAAVARAEENEACAKVCEGLGVHPALNVFNGGPEWYKHGKDCAAAIRART